MKWEWFWARKTGPSGARDGAEKGGRMAQELERGKRQAANNGCWEPWRTRSSAGGQEGRKGKACPSLLEAARVHRATSSPPQLKAFYCLPCSCGFSGQKRLCYGGARGPEAAVSVRTSWLQRVSSECLAGTPRSAAFYLPCFICVSLSIFCNSLCQLLPPQEPLPLDLSLFNPPFCSVQNIILN